MKRQLSLVLALVMILGSFSAVFAAEMPVTQVEKANFLKEVKVLEGNLEGKLNLEQDLKRRDALVVLSRLFDVEEKAKATSAEELTFTDLTDEFYNGFIAWALEEGYAKGKVEGVTFDPNGPLTTQAFATMTLRALGYEEDGKDVFAEAYKIAKDLGILEGVEVEEKDTVTRGDMAAMTYNALGVVVKGGTKTLAETLNIVMPEEPKAKELKVEKIYADNLKEITIELSNAELANVEKLENINNYRLSGNEIERVEVKGNDVLVQVKNVLRDGREYELLIKDVEKSIDGKHKFVAKDNTIPAVEEVEVLGGYGIKVITSEPISDIRSNNFLIDGKNVTMDVEQYGRTIILTPYRGSFSDDTKTLTIEGLKDFAGFKSAKEDFDVEIIKDEVAPEVVDVILKGDTVEVIFNKDIYKSSVGAYWNRSDVGNISYELGRQNIYANKATKVDTNKVVYEFKNNEVPSRRDKVTIEGVQNHSKVKMEKETFGLREVLDDIEPEIIEKKMTAKSTSAKTATVKLYFDKDVTGVFKGTSDNEFNVDAHFTLYEDEIATRYKSDEGVVASAKYDVDAAGEYIKDVIVVELEDLEIYDRLTNDLEYILEIEGFTNTTSSRYKMFRDYHEFKFTTSSDFVVSGGTVNYKGTTRTEITLNFNRYLDRVTAEDATNYVFYNEKASGKVMSDDLADLDGKAELVGNGTKLIITVPEDWADLIADFDGLRISDSIKDTAGNRLSETYYFDLDAELLVGKDQTAADVGVANAMVKYNEALAAVVEANYTTASWSTYQGVVAANVVTVANTKAQIDTATANITSAQLLLVAKADLTAYNAALAAVVETDYTALSWTAYQGIVTANVVTAEDTQVDVDAATAKITAAAQLLLVEMAEAVAPVAPTITTSNGTDLTLTGLAATGVTATANGVTVTIPAGTVTVGTALVNGDTVTVVITVAATSTESAGVFTYEYDVAELGGTFVITLQ